MRKRKISFVNRVVFSSKVDNGCHNVGHIAENAENVSNAGVQEMVST